ncbi:hypothetical protein [Desulfoferrobacter suflitae]|uniref:hypothetical protein n=1 Tax=Desulfoferrobacter suflitae TaxID=2865782 RepID=UPI002164CFCD|nr:hypothetical protein [Desulfoferrobacter suflitae]MCK8601379.1 hypothetical protein [Desulfoferrobacter suflitae]
MKKFLLLVVVLLLAPNVYAGGPPPDKVAHFSGGVVSGLIATAVANEFVPRHRLIAGIVLGTIPGIIIEAENSTYSAGFSEGDLLAHFLGSVVGSVISDKLILKFLVDERGPNKAYGVQVGKRF